MIDDMQVYIANLGKYNEGELVGDWFSFPLDEEVIAERIRNCFRCSFELWDILSQSQVCPRTLVFHGLLFHFVSKSFFTRQQFLSLNVSVHHHHNGIII